MNYKKELLSFCILLMSSLMSYAGEEPIANNLNMLIPAINCQQYLEEEPASFKDNTAKEKENQLKSIVKSWLHLKDYNCCYGEDASDLANLLKHPRKDLEQKFLEKNKNYIESKKNNSFTDLEKIHDLKEMELLAQALYLISNSTEDIHKNIQLYKKEIALQYHPDKCSVEAETEFNKEVSPLLKDNQISHKLSQFIETAQHKLNSQKEALEQQSNLKIAATILSDPVVSSSALVFGYRLLDNVLPNKKMENHYYKQCIQNAQKSAFKIENELVKHLNKY